MYTVDHEDGGRTRLDVDFAWADAAAPVPVTPDEEIVCDVSAGYVCARDVCSVLWRDDVRWWPIGATHMLALQDGMLLEYDTVTFAPTGAPLAAVPTVCSLRVLSICVLACAILRKVPSCGSANNVHGFKALCCCPPCPRHLWPQTCAPSALLSIAVLTSPAWVAHLLDLW